MAFLVLAALILVVLAALVAASRFVARDGGNHPRPPSPVDAEWHPSLRSRPYAED